MLLRCIPSIFSSIRLTVWEKMSFEAFKDGRHGDNLRYRNRTNIAILNLQVTKVGLSLTLGSGADVVSRFLRWPPSDSQILANLNLYVGPMLPMKLRLNPTLQFGRRCCSKNFKMAAIGYLGYRNGIILAILNLCMSLKCLASSFGSFQLTVWEEVSFEKFQDGRLRYRN